MNSYKRLEHVDNVTIKDADGIWFGDPCYVVPDDLWDRWCAMYTSYEREHADLPRCYVAECTSKQHTFYTWNTAWGDGCYPLYVHDEHVADLGVDAGTLSAIPVSLIRRWHGGVPNNLETLGHVIQDAHVGGYMHLEHGDLTWGDIRLPTGGTDDEQEYDPYDEQEHDEYV